MDMSRANTIRLQKILKKDVQVEKALRRKLREWDHLTDEQLILCTVNNFELKISAQEAKKDNEGNVVEATVPAHTKAITKDAVIVKDVLEHLDWVVEKRGMERSSVSVKIYIDSGEGSCKVLATVMDANHDPDIMDMRVEQPGNRLTGVNRVLVLAYVEQIQESHNNLRRIPELLNLKDIRFKVCGDLKIINIILGLSGHGGKYACAFCHGECTQVARPIQTFCHLWEQLSMFQKAGCPQKKMQLY